jgi:hypothetical protein
MCVKRGRENECGGAAVGGDDDNNEGERKGRSSNSDVMVVAHDTPRSAVGQTSSGGDGEFGRGGGGLVLQVCVRTRFSAILELVLFAPLHKFKSSSSSLASESITIA